MRALSRQGSGETAVVRAHAMIDEAMARYHTDQVFAAFSGGHDSLTGTHVASFFQGRLLAVAGVLLALAAALLAWVLWRLATAGE